MNRIPLGLLIVLFLLSAFPGHVWALASNNIPLDSPVYQYLDKLAGFGLITSDTKGIRPYSKAEAARLLLEAEANLVKNEEQIPPLAFEVIKRIRELVPREASLRKEPEKAPLVDYTPVASARLRYVYLDGKPRSYNRDVLDPANQSAFGFIGGNLRPQPPSVAHQSGTEGTPLLENNEGVVYGDGHNLEFRWSMEGYLGRYATVLVEPNALHTDETNRLSLQKGYLKLGSGGVGRGRGGRGLAHRNHVGQHRQPGVFRQRRRGVLLAGDLRFRHGGRRGLGGAVMLFQQRIHLVEQRITHLLSPVAQIVVEQFIAAVLVEAVALPAAQDIVLILGDDFHQALEAAEHGRRLVAEVDQHVRAGQRIGALADDDRGGCGQGAAVAAVRNEGQRGLRPQQAVDAGRHGLIRGIDQHVQFLPPRLGHQLARDGELVGRMGVKTDRRHQRWPSRSIRYCTSRGTGRPVEPLLSRPLR